MEERLPEVDLKKELIGKTGEVTPQHLLFFARFVMVFISALMVLAAICYYASDKDHIQQGREIFEFAKTSIPPIATLILGFYFRGAKRGE